MNQKRYLEYLKEYTLAALQHSGDDLSQAADYLARHPRPGLLIRDRKERLAALERVKKVFESSRERSWYIVLKSLGLDDLAKERL